MSISVVTSYERTSCQQKKIVSDDVSSKTPAACVQSMPLYDSSVNIFSLMVAEKELVVKNKKYGINEKKIVSNKYLVN